jgi:predicted component of type VI protein secretion system
MCNLYHTTLRHIPHDLTLRDLGDFSPVAIGHKVLQTQEY